MIGIKDMQMPKYCNPSECLLCHFNGHVFYCTRKDGMYPVGDLSNQLNKPPKDCPLIEISLREEDDEACCADSW